MSYSALRIRYYSMLYQLWLRTSPLYEPKRADSLCFEMYRIWGLMSESERTECEAVV